MPPLRTDTASCLAQRGSWDGRVGGEIKKEKAPQSGSSGFSQLSSKWRN